jgi:hypothetical protein
MSALFLAGCVLSRSGRDLMADDIVRIRAATAGYRMLDSAVAAGYARHAEHCIAEPSAGMGYHHANPALVDRVLDIERPEYLVYERLPAGEYQLNAVEYVVPFTAWPGDSVPPRFLGHDLKRAPSLGLWYLHVWAWLENPSGPTADYNPRVRC